VLHADELTFAYAGELMRYELQVPRGVVCAVLGPSGSGKSTLLDLLAGFLRPTAGRVVVAGRDVTALPPSQRPFTSLFQQHNLFAHLDVVTNVGLGIHPGLSLTALDRGRVAVALERLGLEGLERRLPDALSGGERQRVALARCLVRDRPILLLDEPFAALGPAMRADLLDLVDAIRRERELTVLMVSHQPRDARRIAELTAFVVAGRIVALGPTAELFAAPPAELAAYLGEAPTD
jgi:thiamine transport system ATP-binding protein